jgi:DNA-binding transcriptional LysR family regulator
LDSADTIARRLTLRELRLFLAAARSGSILKAAGEVGLSQPALSKCIADLESTLGVRLFDRTNRGITPTPHGEVVLRRATGVFEELRHAVDDLAHLTEGVHGELRIGGTPSMCAGLLPRAIAAVAAKRPGLRFQVTELELEKLAGDVLTRTLDFGVGREHPAGDASLMFDRLFEDKLFIVAGAQHPLASRQTVALEETVCHQWILPGAQGAMALQLKRQFSRQKLELPTPLVSTMSMLVRYQLIATNRFLTVIPGSVLRFGDTPGYLRVLPVDLPAGVPIGIFRLKGRTLAPSAQMLMHATQRLAEQMDALSAKQLRRELRR